MVQEKRNRMEFMAQAHCKFRNMKEAREFVRNIDKHVESMD